MRAISRPFIGSLVSLIFAVSLTGCGSDTLDHPAPTAFPFVSGNWEFASTDPRASTISSISGALMGSSTNVSGILHVNGTGTCVSPNEVIEVSGWTNQGGVMTLTGSLAGGTLTLQGVMSVDGTSWVLPWYSVSGGSCAVPGVVSIGQNYKPVTGTYTGSFQDSNGLKTNLAANLTQSSQPDANGNYSLTGQGTFTAFPCLREPAQLTNTEVTGSHLKMTYIDPVTNDAVVVSAQVTSNGQTINVVNWTLAGGCATDAGIGSLVKQPS
jgi:hypothetical protein